MKYWLYMRGGALYPADERSERMFKRLVEGEALQLELQRSRSYQWHKMYVACCIEIGANQDPPRPWESIDYELRVRAGHFDVLPMADMPNIEIRVPRRIAFEKLSADQWAELWPSLDQAMQERFGFDYEAWKNGLRQRWDEKLTEQDAA